MSDTTNPPSCYGDFRWLSFTCFKCKWHADCNWTKAINDVLSEREAGKFKYYTDRFRHHEFDRDQADASSLIRESAENLEAFIALRCEPSREKEIAFAKLEECVMWANKALAVHGAWNDSEGC